MGLYFNGISPVIVWKAEVRNGRCLGNVTCPQFISEFGAECRNSRRAVILERMEVDVRMNSRLLPTDSCMLSLDGVSSWPGRLVRTSCTHQVPILCLIAQSPDGLRRHYSTSFRITSHTAISRTVWPNV